jgi:P27 family predicted phage terminase small subunit
MFFGNVAKPFFPREAQMPAKKSAEHHWAAGNYRRDRHGPLANKYHFGGSDREAEASPMPGPPSFLDKEARAVWRRLAGDLHGVGLLTTFDATAFGLGCADVIQLVRVNKALREQGETYKSGTLTKVNPLVNVADVLSKRVAAWLDQFGLTPQARKAMEITLSWCPADEDDEDDEDEDDEEQDDQDGEDVDGTDDDEDDEDA